MGTWRYSYKKRGKYITNPGSLERPLRYSDRNTVKRQDLGLVTPEEIPSVLKNGSRDGIEVFNPIGVTLQVAQDLFEALDKAPPLVPTVGIHRAKRGDDVRV